MTSAIHARAIAGVIAALGMAPAAHAAVTISSSATQNIVCASGVCTPTAADAVLNVTDLENALAAGNTTVTTTGAGGVQADAIVVDAALNWSSSSVLTLDAYQGITVDKPISVTGLAGISFVTNDGGSGGYLLFGPKGDAAFANLSSTLAINGTPYTLLNTLPALAAAIAANPAGAYALAASYNAKRDGTYSASPIPTVYTGSFNGLGNKIANLTINDSKVGDFFGLFTEIGQGGSVASIGVADMNLQGSISGAGGLTCVNEGTIVNAFATGTITLTPSNSDGVASGLVTINSGGTIVLSHADVTISVNGQDGAGGLVGGSTGAIVQSYAAGRVTVGTTGIGGGLAGSNNGSITQSYSTAFVSGDASADVGGLMGVNALGGNGVGTVSQAYSSGTVKLYNSRNEGLRGGLIGSDYANAGSISDAYWDRTTSHVGESSKGAGYPSNDPGITGLTNAQLLSALPTGFDPTVWAQSRTINNGLPYLINNPPSK